MPHNLYEEYARRTDDEILELISQRRSLTEEAKGILDAELSRRHLTPADLQEHKRFVRKMERLEFRQPRPRKLFGAGRLPFLTTVVSAVIMIIFEVAVFALIAKLKPPSDWEEAILSAVFPLVIIPIWWRVRWRDPAFWLCLTCSSLAALWLVHVWARHRGGSGLRESSGGILYGFLFWVLSYGAIWSIRKRRKRNISA